MARPGAAGRRVLSGALGRCPSHTWVIRCFQGRELGRLPICCCVLLVSRLPRGLAANWPVLADGCGRRAAGRPARSHRMRSGRVLRPSSGYGARVGGLCEGQSWRPRRPGSSRGWRRCGPGSSRAARTLPNRSDQVRTGLGHDPATTWSRAGSSRAVSLGHRHVAASRTLLYSLRRLNLRGAQLRPDPHLRVHAFIGGNYSTIVKTGPYADAS